MASSSSSSRQVKHQVFLSFRGEDTRVNFTAHLLQALKDKGWTVFFDDDTLKKGEKISSALSNAIAASILSIIILSKDYASSNSCLGELSDIMDRKRNPTDKYIVLPIFYHVNPSHVQKIGGTFKTSFQKHESKQPADRVQRWKSAFQEVGALKGWHIGGKSDRYETEYIEDVVEYISKELDSNCTSVSEELVGIDDQKKIILGLIEQEHSRVIGLWGMGGIGKTTLADVVYSEICQNFESHLFLRNVSEKIKNVGNESLRNELFSKLLNQKGICINSPSIGHPYQERLNNKKVLVVLDDVSNPDQIEFMGVKHFGPESKIIVTSRDRQVLKNGRANHIYEVKKLNENDSLQLFSTLAFKLLNPAADFQDLSCKFVGYAQGNPLALKVLGSKLYTKSRKEWESEVDSLKQYAEPKMSHILKSSLDGLRELEKNIFLDIACFFKGEKMDTVEKILSNYYMGAMSGIRNLVDKCLLDSIDCYSMHDMLEEIGKDIVRQECKEDPGKRSRLWFPEDVDQVLRYNKGTVSIEGIKLDMFQMDELQLCPSVFESMLNLKYICFYDSKIENGYRNPKFLVDQVDSISLPNKLRYLCWDYFPLKTLSSFNPKNLVMLILRSGNMEQLWNENDHMNLVNLREIDVSNCKKLRKIPNLSRATNLELLDCSYCESLVELPSLNHLASRDEDKLRVEGCYSLRKFPQVPSHFCYLDLRETEIEEVPDAIKYLHKLERLLLSKSKVEKVSINISKLELLSELNLSECPMVEFPKIPRSLTWLDLSGTGIEEAALSLDSLSNLQYLNMSGSSIQKLMCNITLFGSREFPTVDFPTPSLRSKILNHMRMDRCESLKLLSELPPYMQNLNVQYCTSLEKVSFADQNLYQFDSLGDDLFGMLFCNCINLNPESIDNIEENAMLKIGSLAKKWAARYDWKYQREDFPRLICCFPGNKISADKFKYQRMNSSLCLKIAPNRGSGSRFLVFAICLVADLTHCHRFKYLNCICEYHLTAAGGGDSKSYISKISFFDCSEPNKYNGDHVFILSSNDMVEEDKNYEEASFKFYIIDNDDEVNEEEDYNKVERCGVHVFYVDATEKRVAGNKRSFSHDGEEGDGGLKRLK
ncbi:hypothetical protein ES319_D10G269700v1 [Gossypium barbadense]|uniref:TIR domain-containing protein n=1 Tax=Gossypium barbadense TaxID=3634 RepID=A0A5J5PW04_GOSBA|nr:hypothetical protein ES319_D10G269700v1 [Gossypium barbadense]